MFNLKFFKILLHFLAWFFAITGVFIIQVVFGLQNIGNQQPVHTSLYLEYLMLNLAWIIALSFPISGLFSASSAYISVLLDKSNRELCYSGKTARSRLTLFLAPAATLGACIALVCLLTMLFVVPNANSRIISLVSIIKTGNVASTNNKTDRTMSIAQLMNQVNQLSLESTQADQEKKNELTLKQNKLMVEVYKKFAIPLLGLLLPILGSILALILSKLRSGQRMLLFLFDIAICLFSWLFLITGEVWGDRGALPPIVGMFLSPMLVAGIISALIKRCSEILASPKVCL